MFTAPGLSRYFLTASSSPDLVSPNFAARKFGPGSVRNKVSLTMAACGLALREHSRKMFLRRRHCSACRRVKRRATFSLLPSHQRGKLHELATFPLILHPRVTKSHPHARATNVAGFEQPSTRSTKRSAAGFTKRIRTRRSFPRRRRDRQSKEPTITRPATLTGLNAEQAASRR